MQFLGSLISTLVFTFIDAMENKKLPNCLKECKAGMSNLIDYRFITLSVSISLPGVELH